MRKMTVIRTPIIDALKKHQRQHPLSFHVPGHKNGDVSPIFLNEFKEILSYDVTELEGLDDLHDPSGPIAESQQLCAQLYGAQETHFLVGGSTSGNLAMIYGLCNAGDVVLVQRNCHQSVLNGLRLARAKVVFLQPAFDQVTSHPVGLSTSVLKKAISQYPEAKVLLLTYPNYWGQTCDQTNVIRYAKEKGLLVLCDEAHGPHFVVGDERCPESTFALGADVVVQSAHKMLPALTMAAWMHVQKSVSVVQRTKLKAALTMLQSSSPSYLLLASLDGARAFLESDGKRAYYEAVCTVEKVKQQFLCHDGCQVVTSMKQGYLNDPLKVTIKTNISQSGVVLAQELAKAGIWSEMADQDHVLLVFGLGQKIDEELLGKRLQQVIWTGKNNQSFRPFIAGTVSAVSELIDMKKYVGCTVKVSLDYAQGRIIEQPVTPYPPGVPLLYPGEYVTAAMIKQLKQLMKAGVRFQGHHPQDGLWVREVESEK